MGNLSNIIPFTEICERVMSMARVDTPNNIDYTKGIVNDVYVRDIPAIDDWQSLVQEASVAAVAAYSTGTVAVTAGTTAVVGTGTTFTAGMLNTSGYRIKFANNDNVYGFTYTATSTGTITPALSGASSIAGGTFVVYKEDYALASDFDRFLQNGSFYSMSGGRVRDVLGETPNDTFRADYTAVPSDPAQRLMMWRTDSSGNRTVRLNPPPLTAKVYPYEYVQKITPMTDYRVGTVAVTATSTGIVGTDTYWSANVAVGDYFRVDGNGIGDSSKWYKIATVTDNTHIVLETAFGEATESSLSYTISKAPTALPSEFHQFIIYEAVLTIVAEQGDTNIQAPVAKRDEILRRLRNTYKNRNTNTQYAVESDYR